MQLILTRHPNRDIETIVGWDEQTSSYYMRVYDLNGDTLLNIGAKRPSDIRSIPSLRLRAGEYERLLTQSVTAKLKWSRNLREGNTVIDLSDPAPQTAA